MADWVSVAVSLALGIAVYLLSRAANATARQAKAISEQEAMLRREAATREGRLLLIYLDNEFRQALGALNNLATGLDIIEHDTYVANGHTRGQFAADVRAISLKLSQEVFPRLHVLNDGDAHDIARLISGLAVMKHAAEDAASIDLGESMPGIDGQSWDAWRRGILSGHFKLLCKGVTEMQAVLLRLIEHAGDTKLAAGAIEHTNMYYSTQHPNQ
ncbi:hypothetical protein [Xanthomonas arboricola]|uniref:hypothetical protein n=1 Tax=Xanthomonas arboricola TaxID=56448 RepID=UPI001829928B|nr:hypothetical protein [Xanthomonas arboricola]